MSIFDIEIEDQEYKSVVRELTNTTVRSKIKEVFFETYAELNKLPYEQCSKTNAKFALGVAKNVKQYSRGG